MSSSMSSSLMSSARRLHDEQVGAAHVLLVARVDLAVGERLELDAAEVDVELVGDPRREGGVAAPREEHEPLARRGHAAGSCPPPFASPSVWLPTGQTIVPKGAAARPVRAQRASRCSRSRRAARRSA